MADDARKQPVFRLRRAHRSCPSKKTFSGARPRSRGVSHLESFLRMLEVCSRDVINLTSRSHPLLMVGNGSRA